MGTIAEKAIAMRQKRSVKESAKRAILEKQDQIRSGRIGSYSIVTKGVLECGVLMCRAVFQPYNNP